MGPEECPCHPKKKIDDRERKKHVVNVFENKYMRKGWMSKSNI